MRKQIHSRSKRYLLIAHPGHLSSPTMHRCIPSFGLLKNQYAKTNSQQKQTIPLDSTPRTSFFSNNASMHSFFWSFKKSICENKFTAEANASSLLNAAIFFFLASYVTLLEATNQKKPFASDYRRKYFSSIPLGPANLPVLHARRKQDNEQEDTKIRVFD